MYLFSCVRTQSNIYYTQIRRNTKMKKTILVVFLVLILTLSSMVNAYGYGLTKHHKLFDKLCVSQNKDKPHISCGGHWHFLSFAKRGFNCEWKCDVIPLS